MLFLLTQSKYQQFFRLFSWFKIPASIIAFRLQKKCKNLHLDTRENNERILAINDLAPDCCCEKHKTSPYSTGPVQNSEKIARFVFSPLSVNPKTGKIKNNIFGHAFTNGCSTQREDLASDDEIRAFKNKFIASDSRWTWYGTLITDCATLRSIGLPRQQNIRAMCVYDTAEKDNPSHAEFFHSQIQEISEEDIVELRYELFEAFNVKNPILPNSYRGGRLN